jgi:hypothetical protein
MIEASLRDQQSFMSADTFQKMADTWNAVNDKGSTHNIEMKHPENLANHYKKWKKHQSRKDAIQDANAQPIISVS